MQNLKFKVLTLVSLLAAVSLSLNSAVIRSTPCDVVLTQQGRTVDGHSPFAEAQFRYSRAVRAAIAHAPTQFGRGVHFSVGHVVLALKVAVSGRTSYGVVAKKIKEAPQLLFTDLVTDTLDMVPYWGAEMARQYFITEIRELVLAISPYVSSSWLSQILNDSELRIVNILDLPEGPMRDQEVKELVQRLDLYFQGGPFNLYLVQVSLYLARIFADESRRYILDPWYSHGAFPRSPEQAIFDQHLAPKIREYFMRPQLLQSR